MEDKIKQTTQGDRFIIEMMTNRFTHDLVSHIRSKYPITAMSDYNCIEFNLQQVKMIDSTSIGYLFELHNKLKSGASDSELIISVGGNNELKDLLHKFQVDLLLNVK